MQKIILFKIAIIGLLMALLAVPLMMIESTISSRNSFRQEAVQSIASDSVGAQTLVGPMVVIPYTESFLEPEVIDEKTKRVVMRQRILEKHLLAFPNELKITSNIDTDQRYRGIHKVLVYSGVHALTGSFDLPTEDAFIRNRTGSKIEVGQAFISIGLSDTRGLKNIPKIQWNGSAIEFQQNSKLSSFEHGIHAPLEISSYKKVVTIPFSMDLSIDGIEQLAFVPIAKDNQVTINSKWPHPQFFGRFLPSPKDRKIDEQGFSATWNISALSSNAQQQIRHGECCRFAASVGATSAMPVSAESSSEFPAPAKASANVDTFGVAFIEPINIYSQADRAIKYGLLFIALTFAAFFLFEILKQLPIHPIQYTLVGLALALFFLLLVSLSEHMQFLHAYLISGGACIALIGFYLNFALRSWKRGLGFTTALTVLYSVLFGLLQSENNALVMGSILLFAVLAVIMLITRKVDWYQIGKVATDNVAPKQ